MVVVSHLFLFLWKSFRGRCDSHESHLPLIRTIYFPIAPFNVLPAPDEEERDSVSRQRGFCKYSNQSDPGR